VKGRKKKQGRKTLATYGARGQRVRVLVDRHSGLVRAQWYEQKQRCVKSWPDSPEGRRDADAWAAGLAASRSGRREQVERLTDRAIWRMYVDAEFDGHRPKTRQNYTDNWNKWELFRGPGSIAEDARPDDVDRFRKALRAQNLGVGTIQRIVTTIKRVFNWADGRDLLNRNRLSSYRYRIAKDERPVPPGEYTRKEREAIIAALAKRRHRSDGWRPWAAVMLEGHQAARAHSVLHLRWEDIDWVRGLIIWRAPWDKMGKEWYGHLTLSGYSALLAAREWRERDCYSGPWVFYSAHRHKNELGNDPRATFRGDSLWLALRKAERLAKVVHKKGRATHGFRRGAAGDVLEATGDAKLALDWIGDSDLRQAQRYLKVRNARLADAAAEIDRMEQPKPSPNRHEWREAEEPTPELVGVGSFEEQARQESNLQPPVLETGALPIELRT
jgi:integrase